MSAVILPFPTRETGKEPLHVALPDNLRRRLKQVCVARNLSAGETASVLSYCAQMHSRGDCDAAIVATAREAARNFRDGGPGAA